MPAPRWDPSSPTLAESYRRRDSRRLPTSSRRLSLRRAAVSNRDRLYKRRRSCTMRIRRPSDPPSRRARCRRRAVMVGTSRWRALLRVGPPVRHAPSFDLPPHYQDRYLDPYLAAIAYEDSQIGRLIVHLESRRLLEDTLVVVVGDHGESLGDHGEESHGIFVYQEALRVPLIMRGPGVSARRVTGPVRLVDVTPTVLSLLGLTAPDIDGTSLMGRGERGGPEGDLEVS